MLVARALALALAALLAACKERAADPEPRADRPHLTVEGCALALRPAGDVVVDPWAPPLVESAPAGAPSGPPAPRVRLERPTIQGAVSVELVRRVLGKHQARFEACYAAVIRARPAVAGTSTAQLTIGPDGTVVAGHADGLDDELGRCIIRALRAITFPKPKGGGATVVRQPITFRMESEAPPEPEGPPPADAAPPPPPSPLAALTWADEGADPALDRWIADHATPAVGAATGAADCRLADLTGSLRARLGVGADGVVAAAEVGGLGSAGAEDCLRDHLAGLALPAPPSPAAVTCALVAGAARPLRLTVRPADHVIDVDAIADRDRLRAEVTAARAADPATVFVVRATGATTAAALARVVETLERPRAAHRIGVDDGSGGLILVSDLVPRGAGPASAGAWPRPQLRVSRATVRPDDPRVLRAAVADLAACTDCERILELTLAEDADGAALRAVAEAAHAAGLERVVIVP